MRILKETPEMEACNKINGEACERRMEDWIFIAELIGKLDNIDKYVKEDFFMFVYKQIRSEEYMMHLYGHESKREIIAREALEKQIRKELENQK